MAAPNVSLFGASATEGESITEPDLYSTPGVSEVHQSHEGWGQAADALASDSLWQDHTVQWGEF